jgi:cyclopropane fatty-acyl-phospholipid synthase-like methyltransferase
MTTLKDQTAIQSYFAKRARCYEEAYSVKKTKGLRGLIYRFGWFPLRLIFSYTMDYLAGAEPQRVLDIGCGTGIYMAELAGRGIAVTGLDSCKEMIDATENLLARSGLSDRVQTVLVDYLDWSRQTGQEYDLALAIGVLDLVDVNDAGIYLASFRRVAQEAIVTFPSKHMFSFMADFNYRQHGVRGYVYTQQQIQDLLRDAGLEIVHFKKIFPSTYWVHARRVAI